MLDPAMDQAIRAYLRAKDEGHRELFADAFTPDATFISRFDFETDFSDDTPRQGLPAIAETLGQLTVDCDPVVTLCTADSVVIDGHNVVFRWIVAMSTRAGDESRVAWGDYLWTFDPQSLKATRLLVNMRQMLVLGQEHDEAIFGWLRSLPTPWCQTSELIGDIPDVPDFTAISAYFGGR